MQYDTALLDELVGSPSGHACVVSIGNFDGVHRGHRQLLARALRDARERGLDLEVVTFEPHPDTFFRGLAPDTFRLSSSAERAECLRQAGARRVHTLPFDERFAGLTAEAFMEGLVLDRLGARAVHVGYDFSYGRGREGSVDTLRQLANEHGFTAVIHDPITLDGSPVSSTRVRDALRSGEMGEVGRLLGRPFELSGTTAAGAGRGAGMGAPTLNLYPEGRLLPPLGVYACTLEHEGHRYDAVASLGIRPTYDDGDRISFETYVIEPFPVEARGLEIRVALLEFLRPELRFDSTEALMDAIRQDVEDARAALARLRAER
jgi:riboflavin kinase/FMN adenylyltransferase